MSREILLILGYPGSGKSTIAELYVAKGYQRLNRDIEGKTLEALLPKLEILLTTTTDSVVLDNTYPTPLSRAGVIALGKKYGIPVRALVMSTTIEEAQYNVASRMIGKYGKLIEADDMKGFKDVGLFPATVLFHYRKHYVAPTMAEGFTSVEDQPFVRHASGHTNKGIIFDYDGTLRKTKSGDKYPRSKEDIEILPGRAELLQLLRSVGYKLCGVSNQSVVSKGELSKEFVADLFTHTNKLLGLKLEDIDIRFCPHSPNPINCYCRKPMPGLGTELVLKHQLDPAQTLMVGDLKTDESFARRVGIKFVYADEFFANPDKYITR